MKLRVSGKTVEWEGGRLTFSIPVQEAAQIGERIVVIHDYTAYPRGRAAPNLVAYSLAGEQLWVAENLGILGSSDAYVGFLSEEPLWVYNFAGYQCRIDPETGRLLEREFTK
jgi:hypothetical protein